MAKAKRKSMTKVTTTAKAKSRGKAIAKTKTSKTKSSVAKTSKSRANSKALTRSLSANDISDKALEFGKKATAAASALTAGAASTISEMSHKAAEAAGPLKEQAVEKLAVA
ncbi:MAG: hypothetical protein WBE81_04060, partial [Pseudolabrys sp.]